MKKLSNIAIKATPSFLHSAKKLLACEILESLYEELQYYPEGGRLIPGTGGVRKLRWKTGLDNKGKSGGVRILYHYSKDVLILLVAIYGKSEKENITQSERNELKKMVPQLVARYKEGL